MKEVISQVGEAVVILIFVIGIIDVLVDILAYVTAF